MIVQNPGEIQIFAKSYYFDKFAIMTIVAELQTSLNLQNANVNQSPRVTKLKKSTLYEILAILFSFQNSFYFYDRLSISGGISIYVRAGIIDKRTILTTNRMLTGVTQPHEYRYSSNRNSHGLSKR